MKNKPLAVQIWIVFASIMLGLSVILSLFILVTLRIFFTNEMFTTIEDVQRSVWSNEIVRQETPIENIQFQQNQRMVNHMIFLNNGHIIPSQRLPRAFLEDIYIQAQQQQQISARYRMSIGEDRLLYVIRKGRIGFQEASLVSYMFDTYRNDLVVTLFQRLMYGLIGVLIVSWIPAILLARYLSKPFVQMERHVQQIADRKWDKAIHLDREDEIGRLGRSIEEMRKQLIKQEETQQSLLQNVSHELKTPVMVIRSYAQSIKDGIYPKGNLGQTVDVIENESKRLEELIKNLIYLTKLDDLTAQQLNRESFNLQVLIYSVIERLKWQRPELAWELNVMPVHIVGDYDQWKVAMENIIDNQIRFATERITVRSARGKGSDQPVMIIFSNDGEPIEPAIFTDLFQTFKKGKGGQFGLGLSIVKRVMDLHAVHMHVENAPEGVRFTFTVPTIALNQSQSRGHRRT